MIATVITCSFLAVLLNLPMLLRARHQRNFAEAKLEIAKVVTEMDRMMLEGRIKLGEACHDHVYKEMVEAVYADKFCIDWNLWKPPTEEAKRIRRQVHEEAAGESKMGELFRRFIRAELKAFSAGRPFFALGFSCWVLIYAGGILAMLTTQLLTLIAIRNFKLFAAEWYNVLAYKSPSFQDGSNQSRRMHRAIA